MEFSSPLSRHLGLTLGLYVGLLPVSVAKDAPSPFDGLTMDGVIEIVKHMAAENPLPNNYQDRIDQHWETLLLDASSRKILNQHTEKSLVCGLVNAKNSYGAYTGYHPFVAMFGKDEKVLFLYSPNYKDIYKILLKKKNRFNDNCSSHPGQSLLGSFG